MDPRSTVVIGVGQVNCRGEAPEPLELMVAAARTAGRDTSVGTALEAVDHVGVIHLYSRRYGDPAALLARLLGIEPRSTGLFNTGGQSGQAIIDRVAARIAAGVIDVALLAGGESWRTRQRHLAQGSRPPWPTPPTRTPASDVVDALDAHHPVEQALHLVKPIEIYPLFETAHRVALGRSVDDHRQSIAALWARFSEVAAGNPNATVRARYTADEILEPTPSNRMIGFPYTKLMNANNAVDQAAALIVCSSERADDLGVPHERRVYLHAAVEADEVQYVSNRAHLGRSPAIRAMGSALHDLCGVSASDVDHVDLYSCFPAIVQIAAGELGLSLDRPLTVTGGLTFAGGPWNSYVLHSVATTVELLRGDDRELGLCTANGGLMTKHAVGLYGARPPVRTRLRSLGVVEAGGEPELVADHDGRATIETYTVMHDRAGCPTRTIAMCRTPGGHRAWGRSDDRDVASAGVLSDLCGATVELGPGARLEVSL